jgi:hypothetical protein
MVSPCNSKVERENQQQEKTMVRSEKAIKALSFVMWITAIVKLIVVI